MLIAGENKKNFSSSMTDFAHSGLMRNEEKEAKTWVHSLSSRLLFIPAEDDAAFFLEAKHKKARLIE